MKVRNSSAGSLSHLAALVFSTNKCNEICNLKSYKIQPLYELPLQVSLSVRPFITPWSTFLWEELISSISWLTFRALIFVLLYTYNVLWVLFKMRKMYIFWPPFISIVYRYSWLLVLCAAQQPSKWNVYCLRELPASTEWHVLRRWWGGRGWLVVVSFWVQQQH